MRIAVWHNLPSGGGKRQLFDHLAGLTARGHHVEVWSPSTADQEYLPLNGVVAREHILPLEMPAPARFNPLGGALRRLSVLDAHCREAADQIARGGFDLLYAGSCRFLRVTSVARHLAPSGLPTSIYLGEPYRPLYEASPTFRWMAPAPPAPGHPWWSGGPRHLRRLVADLMDTQGLRVQAREEYENARAYSSILVNSLFSRESVLRAYGLDARVCYLGIDTERFRFLNQAREPFVIGIGAIAKEKNIRFVVEALGRVPAEIRPRLVWVGNFAVPEYLQEVKEAALQRGVVLEPRVAVPDDEIVSLLNRATAMVYAPRLEPFGYAPLEANACGLPVVGVAEGGVRESVRDGVNGLLCEPDANVFARAVTRLMRDPAEARALGEGGRRWVAEQWSLEASIDRLENCLSALAGKAPGTTGRDRIGAAAPPSATAGEEKGRR